MHVIDSHVHLYPPETGIDPGAWARALGENHWAVLCTRRRRDGTPVQDFPTLEQLLATMDDAGVARAVLLGWYWENQATCVLQNRFYARCVAAYPDRLSAFATFHPAAGEAAVCEEIRRARGEGLIGLGELSPHSQGFSVGNPVFEEAMMLAGELRMPVNLHVTEPDSRDYPGKVATPAEDFQRLATRFPGVTFILAHWGARFAACALPNVYVDTAAAPLIYGEQAWADGFAAIPPEKVLFGSDYPLRLYPKATRGAEMRRFIAEAGRFAPKAVLDENAERVIFGNGH